MGSFGTLVKQLRKEKGHVLEYVAKKIGSHKGYLSGIENGKVNPPSARFVRKLSRILEYDEKELLKMAYLEKVPAAVREEFEEALHAYSQQGDKGDTELLPSARLPILNNPGLGYPTQLDREGNPVSLTTSHALVPKQLVHAKYLLFVCDDEMSGTRSRALVSGDEVFLSTTADFKNGDVVFVIYSAHGKKVSKIRELSFKPGGKIVLHPWNKKYSDEVVNWDDVDLLLKVVRHCYELDRKKSDEKSSVS